MRLVLRHHGQVLASHTIHRDEPRVAVNVPLQSTTVTIALEAGPNGPVLDRLWLRHLVVFLGGH